MPERKPGFLNLPTNNLASTPTAKNLEDLMTVKKTRSRVWDRENPNHAFRGINPELADKVKSIAQELEVTQSDVARAFIEDGLKQYWNGYFRFNPTLENGRRTLFPNDLSKKLNENRATRLKGKGGPYWKKFNPQICFYKKGAFLMSAPKYINPKQNFASVTGKNYVTVTLRCATVTLPDTLTVTSVVQKSLRAIFKSIKNIYFPYFQKRFFCPLKG